MLRNNFSTTFSVTIVGADTNTKLDLRIPELDLTFLIIKDGTATLYTRTRKEINRKMFYKNGKCYNRIKSLGFTVGDVKTGNQADSNIRAILKTEGWICNEPDALLKFEGEVKERDEAVRINWKK